MAMDYWGYEWMKKLDRENATEAVREGVDFLGFDPELQEKMEYVLNALEEHLWLTTDDFNTVADACHAVDLCGEDELLLKLEVALDYIRCVVGEP